MNVFPFGIFHFPALEKEVEEKLGRRGRSFPQSLEGGVVIGWGAVARKHYKWQNEFKEKSSSWDRKIDRKFY